MSRKKKGVTVASLKTASAGAFLYCECCGGEYSACSGDYGDYNGHPPEHVFTCCDEPMRLVVRQSRLVNV